MKHTEIMSSLQMDDSWMISTNSYNMEANYVAHSFAEQAILSVITLSVHCVEVHTTQVVNSYTSIIHPYFLKGNILTCT